MARVSPFHSVFEARKPPGMRVYHNNDGCPLGRAIPERERLEGNGNLPICRECERLTRQEPNRWI
jgi:hypothetical protein